jgi:hypothetical protein
MFQVILFGLVHRIQFFFFFWHASYENPNDCMQIQNFIGTACGELGAVPPAFEIFVSI